MTENKRSIEVFSAGCAVCEETIALIKRIACESCDITIHDMRQKEVVARANQLGIRTVPAVVIDGKLADCCSNRGPQKTILRSEGLGVRLS